MPKYQHRIDTHRLFLIEQRGDTLIVSPKGDPAGFANLNFNLEHAALLSLIRKESRKNLLVDLGASNYFGAKILGAFAEWSDVVEEQGGRFALCELSHDMQELLKIFRFEDRWQQFDTREEGIKAIVKETPLEVVRQKWKHLAVVACAAVVLAASFFPWNEYYLSFINQRDYEVVQVIWEDMQQLRAENAPPPEWRKLQNRAHRELTPLISSLEKRAGRRTRQAQAAQHLFMAIKHNILKRLLIKQSRLTLYRPLDTEKEVYWQMTAIHMEKARRILNGENPDTLEFTDRSFLREGPQAPAPKATESDGASEEPPAGEGGTVPDVVPPAIAEKPHPDLFAPESEEDPESRFPDPDQPQPSGSPNGP